MVINTAPLPRALLIITSLDASEKIHNSHNVIMIVIIIILLYKDKGIVHLGKLVHHPHNVIYTDMKSLQVY